MKATFTIDGKPQGKGRHRSAVVNGKVRTYTPEATASYENLVKVMYLQQVGRVRFEGPILARITACYPIPSSWPKKRREQACKGEIYPQTKPDTDNIAKIILDSLNGIAYDDDKQVVGLYVTKAYAEKARVDVYLAEM